MLRPHISCWQEWVTSPSTRYVCKFWMVACRATTKARVQCITHLHGSLSAATALCFLWGHLWGFRSPHCYTFRSQQAPSGHTRCLAAPPSACVPCSGTHPVLSLPSLGEVLLCLRWALRNALFFLLFPLSHSAPFAVCLHCILTQVKKS